MKSEKQGLLGFGSIPGCSECGKHQMPSIEVIPYSNSQGALRAAYDRVRTPDGTVDDVLPVHSLRPHTFDDHMALY